MPLFGRAISIITDGASIQRTPDVCGDPQRRRRGTGRPAAWRRWGALHDRRRSRPLLAHARALSWGSCWVRTCQWVSEVFCGVESGVWVWGVVEWCVALRGLR